MRLTDSNPSSGVKGVNRRFGVRVYKDFKGFTIYVGPWAGRVSWSRSGWFGNGSHYFSGWHRWKDDDECLYVNRRFSCEVTLSIMAEDENDAYAQIADAGISSGALIGTIGTVLIESVDLLRAESD